MNNDYLKDTIWIGAFDYRFTNYGNDLQRARQNIMNHLFNRNNNPAILVAKQSKNSLAFVSNTIISKHALTDSTYTFPLYLYSDDGTKIPNLKQLCSSSFINISRKIQRVSKNWFSARPVSKRQKYIQKTRSTRKRTPFAPSARISKSKSIHNIVSNRRHGHSRKNFLWKYISKKRKHLYKPNSIFRQRPRNRLEFLYRWLSARPEMAQRP